MCYSALVRQDIHQLARRYGAEIAYEMFAELFRRRLDGDDIKATRALEQNFANPKSEVERRNRRGADRTSHFFRVYLNFCPATDTWNIAPPFTIVNTARPL